MEGTRSQVEQSGAHTRVEQEDHEGKVSELRNQRVRKKSTYTEGYWLQLSGGGSPSETGC